MFWQRWIGSTLLNSWGGDSDMVDLPWTCCRKKMKSDTADCGTLHFSWERTSHKWSTVEWGIPMWLSCVTTGIQQCTCAGCEYLRNMKLPVRIHCAIGNIEDPSGEMQPINVSNDTNGTRQTPHSVWERMKKKIGKKKEKKLCHPSALEPAAHVLQKWGRNSNNSFEDNKFIAEGLSWKNAFWFWTDSLRTFPSFSKMSSD